MTCLISARSWAKAEAVTLLIASCTNTALSYGIDGQSGLLCYFVSIRIEREEEEEEEEE